LDIIEIFFGQSFKIIDIPTAYIIANLLRQAVHGAWNQQPNNRLWF
jgi:hypothetical protein